MPGVHAKTAHAAIELLVLQATPFCNLDCDYCYLPDRARRRRMSTITLERIADHIVAAGWLAPEATIVWHAGEPTVLPPRWYADAIAIFDSRCPAETRLGYSFQSNGTLLHEGWLDLLAKPAVRIGISLDGPRELHDRRRRGRDGRGSFDATMRGIALLQAADLPFHVIAVLTRQSMAEPDRLFDFFSAAGIRSIGFNVEEIEGPNRQSSLDYARAQRDYVAFLRRWAERVTQAAEPPMVRELEQATVRVMTDGRPAPGSQQTEPLRIVTVDVDGRLSTFSPELIGARDARYADFVFGDLAGGGPETILASPAFRRAEADIEAGCRACAASCGYFPWCGGGSPSNKLFETGSLASTETLYCRLTEQAPLLAVLEALEANAMPQEELAR